MGEVLERKDQDYVEIYNFIRDRGRALRKDFKVPPSLFANNNCFSEQVQNHLRGIECVDTLERLTRFLIHSDFILCELPETR